MDKQHAIQCYGTTMEASNYNMKDEFDILSLKNVDIREVNTDTLIDINSIKIDTSLPKEERIEKYLKDIENPYCFKSGQMVVKVSYSKNNKTLQEQMENLFESTLF